MEGKGRRPAMSSQPPSGPKYPPALARRYPPIRILGEGGMGSVYLARDANLGRKVAVKILNRAPTEELLERFQREAQVMAGVRHSNVVEVYEAGTLEGHAFLVLEYLEGRSLDRPPRNLNPLDLVEPMAAALETLHGLDLIHRDVKPANVFLTEDERFVLTDFGLVLDPDRETLTATGSFLGTLGYLAPEVLQGQRGLPAQDWWALGVTLYALAERALPFPVEALVAAAGGRPLPVLEFDRLAPESPLRALIEALLEPLPEDRLRSAEEVRSFLSIQRELAGLPRLPGEVTEVSPFRPQRRATLAQLAISSTAPGAGAQGRPRVLGIAASVLVLGTLVGVAWETTMPSARPTPATPVELSGSQGRGGQPWGPEDLARWKQDFESLEGLERGPSGELAWAREGRARPGWRPLLHPTPFHQPAVEASLASLGPVFQWFQEGGDPSSLDPEARQALRDMDEFLEGQGFDGPFRVLLQVTPLPEPDPTLRDPDPLPTPPSIRGWLGRFLRAFLEARIRLEGLEHQWEAFGKGEVELDLSQNARTTAQIFSGGFYRAVEQLRLLPGDQVDVDRWLRPASRAYEVMVRAAARSLREEPACREWLLRRLPETLGRGSLPLSLSMTEREAFSALGLSPRDASEWVLAGLVEHRIESLQDGLGLPPEALRSRSSLIALERAEGLLPGDPLSPLLRGLIAWTRFRIYRSRGEDDLAREVFRDGAPAVHRAVPLYWREFLDEFLKIWAVQEVPPPEAELRRFEEYLEWLAVSDPKGPETRDEFLRLCRGWRAARGGAGFRSRLEGDP